MTYGLNDICLVPARISRVEHRKECNPYNFDDMLPLFTAPMNSIINENNYEIFIKNKINTIIPRGVDFDKRCELSTKTFVAFGLSEFETFIVYLTYRFDTTDDIYYVCVDVANGHMKKLIDLCSQAKDMFGYRLVLMAGNIANPETYIDYALAGIDFVRCNVGSGSCCLTACNVSAHYAMASLIKDVMDFKWTIQKAMEEAKALNINCKYKSVPFIVADGGFDNYDKIIKALALGADYVMIGKLFAQCEEACQEVQVIKCVSPDGYVSMHPELPKNLKWVYNDEEQFYISKLRLYYGMSTKRAQKETGNEILKTSEGIEITVPVLYKLQGWCENFIDYLRSMMSYADSFDLTEFKEKAQYKIISPLEYLSFYK